jgi:hypothetical protein
MEIRTSDLRRVRHSAAFLLGTFLAATNAGTARAVCDFAAVKQQIDNVLDKDAAKGAKFRKEVSEGADSTTMIEALVSNDMQDKVDTCRFEVGEYLTKRGFPPFH